MAQLFRYFAHVCARCKLQETMIETNARRSARACKSEVAVANLHQSGDPDDPYFNRSATLFALHALLLCGSLFTAHAQSAFKSVA